MVKFNIKWGDFFQVSINYHHKDRVFKFIFGNPENKRMDTESL